MNRNVRIRRAEPADATFFHAVRSQPGAARFQPLRPYTVAQLQRLIAQRSAAPLDNALHGKVQWVILEDDQPAGWITLDVTSREHDCASVGYTMSEPFQGRGMASTALRLIVAIAFAPAQLDLERLEAVVALPNIASRRVLERAGFVREGTARSLLRINGVRVDHDRYELLRSDHLATGHPPELADDDRKERALS